MLILAIVFAALAALFHVYVFVLESVTWMTPSTRATFGIANEAEARATRPLALNQGFYNLFLAIMVATGIVLLLSSMSTIGATLVFAGCGVMAGAGIVLAVSNRALLRAAVLQLVPPAVAMIALAVCVAER